MRNLRAYAQSRDMSLEGERAFEELYIRLARWTTEIAQAYATGEAGANDHRVERCVELLCYMDRAIDLSHNYDIASAVLKLNHFAISTLVKAKAERRSAPLERLPGVFITLAGIFATICERKNAPAQAQ
jgi:flagellin-specific chaperone FliS